jgi:hypothetical protein
MKTTTYIFENGITTKTVSDQPEPTRESYAQACRVIRDAAKRYVHEDEHIRLMRRVSHLWQTRNECTAEFSDWKVGTMTFDELQDVLDRL